MTCFEVLSRKLPGVIWENHGKISATIVRVLTEVIAIFLSPSVTN
jgi:hypothetical protein